MDLPNLISEKDKKIWRKLKRNGNFARTKKVLIQRAKKIEPNKLLNHGIINHAHKECISNVSEVPDQIGSSIQCSENLNLQKDEVLDSDSEPESEINDTNPKADMEDLREDLKNWAIKFQIKHTAVNSLLSLLKSHIPDNILPKDARTLVGTPRSSCVTSDPNIGGQYWHYGLPKILKHTLSTYGELPNKLSLNVNIDGLPTFKSSSTSFWPILVNVHELRSTMSPLVVGVFCGASNLTANNLFL